MMQWQSLGELLEMGGYGVYVWPSFAVTVACMVCEVLVVHRRFAIARAAAGRAESAEERA